jgi:protein CpxP
MKSFLKPVLLSVALATAGFAAFSQAPAGDMMGSGGMHGGRGHERMGQMDPAKMQARMDKRNADLKAALKITPAQEGAWTAYTTAMQPPANMMGQHPDRAEMEKLTTPERIDKMKTLRTQHMGEMMSAMDKRGEATKAFYATLTPEQKKTFDTSAMRHGKSEGRHGGHHGGKAPAQPKQ